MNYITKRPLGRFKKVAKLIQKETGNAPNLKSPRLPLAGGVISII